MAWAGGGGAGIGAATVGGGRRTNAAPPGGSAVCPPPGAAGAALGAGVTGAGPVRGGGGVPAPAGGGGAAPPAGGRGGGAIFSRSLALSISISLSRSCCMAGPAGGFGGAGGGAAAGGAGGVGRGGGAAAGGGGACGGAATGGGTCGGGVGRGGGGAGRGGGAAAGAGRAGGAPFGGCLGFPSGPSSSLACATTSGAVCACEGATARCSAVRAVVASSKSRSFVMLVWIPRKILGSKTRQQRFGDKVCQQTMAINEQALGRIVASFKREVVFISDHAKSGCSLVHCVFRRSFQIVVLHFFPVAAIRCTPGADSAAKPIFPVSVAGEGVLGPCGPRTGNSSGAWPGNSSGRGGSPGSCIGGGTSGRGLPGGLSCGGSDGCPGLIGGSSRGSIGIYSVSLRLSPKSGRVPAIAVAAIFT